MTLGIQQRRRALVVSNVAWDFVWQRHQTMASLLARDFDVVFCEIPGMRRVGVRDLPRLFNRLRRFGGAKHIASAGDALPQGLEIVRPFVVPSTNAVFHAINRRLVDHFARARPGIAEGFDLVLTYSAARAAMYLLEIIPHRLLVYDCTDNFSAVRGIPEEFLDDESHLLARADLTLVPGRALAALHRDRARRLEALPHGVMPERFQIEARARASHSVSLLYYGHIHRQHLDCELIAGLARLRPGWRITLVGPVVTKFLFPPNVSLPGQVPHERLRDFLLCADAIILPYAINDYTRAVLPAKTFECLATGLPVVATPLPELRATVPDLIVYTDDAAGFAAAVEYQLASDTDGKCEARRAGARANSWEHRYVQFKEILANLGPPRAPSRLK